MLEISIVTGIIGTDNKNKMQPLNIYVPSIFSIQENNFKLEKIRFPQMSVTDSGIPRQERKKVLKEPLGSSGLARKFLFWETCCLLQGADALQKGVRNSALRKCSSFK